MGLFIVLGYWFAVHPPGFGPIGYLEDYCTDLLRQMMAGHLREFEKPVFRTDAFMAPQGASVPYMSWSMERDWLGAYFWLWQRDFPFHWAYFGLSLVVSYLGVGAILRKMGLTTRAAWGLASVFVVFHVPRHFKIYYHFEHLPQHWIYLSLFLDALIWQRFWRERRWSWVTELWRGFCLLGMFCAAGYFWGPLLLEWGVVRGSLLFCMGLFLFQKKTLRVEGSFGAALVPVVLGVALFALQLRWFLPLLQEARGLGEIWQPLWWFADLKKVFEPLWLSFFFVTKPIDSFETVVTVGWVYWVPFLAGLIALKKKRGGLAWLILLPFLVLLVLLLLYLRTGFPHAYQDWVRRIVPFMQYFRVASRVGLLLPQILGVLIVLSWPELSKWSLERWQNSKTWRGVAAVFFILCGMELLWLAHPIKAMPPMEEGLTKLLTHIRDAAGTTVLDMPFCVAGGNGICTDEQCPHYPVSTAGQCFRAWHDKKVYGLYQARMTERHCQVYQKAPYASWFDAWRTQRCLNDAEWKDFCEYLDKHSELAAVLVYPDIWKVAGAAQCQQAFEQNLGLPVSQASYKTVPVPGRGGESAWNRVIWYRPKCLGTRQ